MASGLTLDIINCVLSGILIKPLFIIWVISLCLARRKSDPARVGFTYMKVVMPLEIIAMTFYVISDALYIFWFDNDDSYYYSDGDVSLALRNAAVRTGLVGGLFERFADIFLVVCLAELTGGFLSCVGQKQRGGFQNILRFGSLGFGVVLLALALAYFGKINAAYTPYFKYLGSSSYYDDDDTEYFDYDAFDDAVKTSHDLVSAFDILLLVSSVAFIALGVFVLVRVHANRVLSSSAVLFLVVTILNFIRYLWSVIYDAAWLLPQKSTPDAVSVVDPILNIWVFFVLLVLLFVLGCRKEKGLWTTPQPWMGGATVPPALSGQPLAPGVAQQHGGWVQYAPGQQIVYVQPAPVYAAPGQQPVVEQGWQGQQQGGYYYPQQMPQMPMQGQEQMEVPNGRAPAVVQQPAGTYYQDPK
ncbi:hypothetical protein NKR23_g7242 [Pleurostoma richardsiae]|uniref:Uncharacterized protein n=1 Tax=Pleurostoma richardsiae TaxID=41990 RepID=A0AA38R8V9_9PEZI|nr:hypothetical protein NKR23_g7242 [Pleurostoma richardsiae]